MDKEVNHNDMERTFFFPFTLRFCQALWALLGLVSSFKIIKRFLTEKTEIVKLLS